MTYMAKVIEKPQPYHSNNRKFLKSTGDQVTCINCLALSLDFASSENNVTSFIAHISPLSLNQLRL